MNTMQVPESPVSQAKREADFDAWPISSRRCEVGKNSPRQFVIRNFEHFPEVLLAVATVSILNTLRKSNEPRRT
jgi:hypothetical protein